METGIERKLVLVRHRPHMFLPEQSTGRPVLHHFLPLRAAEQGPRSHKGQTSQSCGSGATHKAPHRHPGPPGSQHRTGLIYSHCPSTAIRTACCHVGGQIDSANVTYGQHPTLATPRSHLPRGPLPRHVHPCVHVCACGLAAGHT